MRNATGATPVRLLAVGTEVWGDRVRSAIDGAAIEPILATTAEDALEELAAEPRRVDAVLLARDLEDGTGSALLDAIAEAAPEIPVIVAPSRGSESFASAVLADGAVDYVPIGGDVDLAARILDAIDDDHRRRRQHRLAERYEALLADPDRYAWILDREGRVRDASEAARDLVAGEVTRELVAGEADPNPGPFPESAWCVHRPAGFERAVAAAERDGEGRFEAVVPGPDGDDWTVDVVLRPIGEEELLATIADSPRQRRLEAELSRSERLHRVTLNNMTDTVLVTDDAGAFTYVCPNVHFIFGYTAEEVHDLGTVDELLGGDLFDPGELAEEGVLTNVECTTMDEAGNERTLLVNVKEVSIQGGTRLYSCRDVTERKRRERALTTLHGTARDLLYAETEREIAETLVTDATAALDAAGATFYWFDDGEAILRPIAATDRFEELHGPLPELAPDPNSIVGHTFIDGELATFGDVRDSDRLTAPTTGLRGAIFVPIGNYGVLVVGSDRVDAFDDIGAEVADLVAATAEAAVDRVEREAELRRRDRELQQRNERLASLNRINDLIREIDRVVVRAETREEIEHAVCERLTSTGRFGFAWIVGGDDEPAVRVTAGSGQDYPDAVIGDLEEWAEPTAVARRSREPTVVENVADDLEAEPWRREALSRGFQSVLAVPLTYEGVTYGTLAVYATEADAFEEPVRSVLAELGETVASAIGSLKRKDALLSASTTELEYETADPACVPYAIARKADCTITLQGDVQQVEDGVLAFVAVEGAPVEAVAEVAAGFEAVEDVGVVDDAGDGGTLRLRLSNPFVATALADHGAVLAGLSADLEGARLTVDVPGAVDVETIDGVIEGVYGDATLLAQRDRDRRFSTERFRSEAQERLTDRQLEVARTAYHSGYFERPRERSGEEIAEALDVSPATFYQTNRRIQYALFELLFGDG